MQQQRRQRKPAADYQRPQPIAEPRRLKRSWKRAGAVQHADWAGVAGAAAAAAAAAGSAGVA